MQACHALRQFAAEHPQVDRAWFSRSNALVLLSVADEDRLWQLLERARGHGIRAASFFEPDLGDALTAIALEPGTTTRRLCRSLPLLLAEYNGEWPRAP